MAKGLFKFTNVKCLEYDKPFATIPVCRLRMVRRGVVGLNLNVTLHQLPVTNVSVRYKSKEISRIRCLIIFHAD